MRVCICPHAHVAQAGGAGSLPRPHLLLKASMYVTKMLSVFGVVDGQGDK